MANIQIPGRNEIFIQYINRETAPNRKTYELPLMSILRRNILSIVLEFLGKKRLGMD
jgi:hypothetical protein